LSATEWALHCFAFDCFLLTIVVLTLRSIWQVVDLQGSKEELLPLAY
jgi:hypothetical protein